MVAHTFPNSSRSNTGVDAEVARAWFANQRLARAARPRPVLAAAIVSVAVAALAIVWGSRAQYSDIDPIARAVHPFETIEVKIDSRLIADMDFVGPTR